MIGAAAILIASSSMASGAPFVITDDDAIKIDTHINFKKCNIDKNKYSRYYWYKAISDGRFYKIDPYVVIFYVYPDSKGRVYARLDAPFPDGDGKGFKAKGFYYIYNKKYKIDCY